MKCSRCVSSRQLSFLKDKEEVSFIVPDGNEKVKLTGRDIIYIEVQGHYLRFVTEEGSYEMRGVMKEAEEKLKDVDFVRSSNSYLVNLKYVTRVSSDTVQAGIHELPVSRTYKKTFIEAAAKYIGEGH